MNNDCPCACKSSKWMMRSKKSCLPGLTFILKARCLGTKQVCSRIPRSFPVPVTGTSNTSERWCLFLALSLKQSQFTVYHTPPCFCFCFSHAYIASSPARAKNGGAPGTHCLHMRLISPRCGDSGLFSDSSALCDVRVRTRCSILVRIL